MWVFSYFLDSWPTYAIILCILYGTINVSHYTHIISYSGTLFGLGTSYYNLNCIDSGSGALHFRHQVACFWSTTINQLSISESRGS